MSGTPTATAAASEEPQRLLGMRRSAFAEVLFFYAAALIFDAVVLHGQRFAGMTPHPFWSSRCWRRGRRAVCHSV